MNTGSGKRVLLIPAAAALMFVYGAAEAHAGWGSLGGSWGGGSRGYASSGGSWGGSHGRLLGGSRGGPLRNLIGRARAHHSSRGSWGSHGSHGSRGYASRGYGSRGYASRGWGSSGGFGGYASSGGSRGFHYYSSSSGGYSSVGYRSTATYSRYGQSRGGYYQPVISQPVYNTSPAPLQYGTPLDGYQDGGVPAGQPAQAAPLDGGTPPPGPDLDRNGGEPENNGTGLLNLRVPAAAVVYVNGRRTSTPGQFRSYVSRNLKPGKQYTYEVRAEIEKDGELLSRTRVVQLAAGVDKTFDMQFDENQDLITSVTLFVPKNATVSLGGVETGATGPMRYFSTSSLKSGQSWDSYEVAVTVEKDGKPVTRNRVIDVNAGDSVSLRFDFDAEEQVASR